MTNNIIKIIQSYLSSNKGIYFDKKAGMDYYEFLKKINLNQTK